MNIKYEIIDLSNNPNDLQAGDMVKLRKGLRVGKCYAGYTFYKPMRFRYYKVVNSISASGAANIELPLSNGETGLWHFPKVMLDLTFVKRPIKIERLN